MQLCVLPYRSPQNQFSRVENSMHFVSSAMTKNAKEQEDLHSKIVDSNNMHRLYSFLCWYFFKRSKYFRVLNYGYNLFLTHQSDDMYLISFYQCKIRCSKAVISSINITFGTGVAKHVLIRHIFQMLV